MLKVQIKHNSWRKIELKAVGGAGAAAECQQKQQRVAAPGHPTPKNPQP